MSICKRIVVGQKILGQVVAIEPLALIVSLPNLLFGYVPITSVSNQLTEALEAFEDTDGSQAGDEDADKPETPTLDDIFRRGQYVRAVVSAVHAAGTTDSIGLSRSRDRVVKSSRRVELSLCPDKVNEGLQKVDLQPGFVRFALKFQIGRLLTPTLRH